jgi:hypothetical protein
MVGEAVCGGAIGCRLRRVVWRSFELEFDLNRPHSPACPTVPEAVETNVVRNFGKGVGRGDVVSVRKGAQGGLGYSLQFGAFGAAGGLDGEAVDDGGDVAGEIGGVGVGGEIAVGFGLLEAAANRGLAGVAA